MYTFLRLSTMISMLVDINNDYYEHMNKNNDLVSESNLKSWNRIWSMETII